MFRLKIFLNEGSDLLLEPFDVLLVADHGNSLAFVLELGEFVLELGGLLLEGLHVGGLLLEGLC